MEQNTISKITLYLILGISLGFNTLAANADDDKYNFSLGVKLLASNWRGEKTNSGTKFKEFDEFEENEGGQLGWNIGMQTGRFYTGLSLQGGEYDFANKGPTQVTNNDTVNVNNVKVTRAELDLLVGYYFWDNISIFVDFKSIHNKHDKNDYKQNFSGIGLGVAGAWPYNAELSVYGSFGFVPNGDLEANDTKVGTGDNVAIEFGVVFQISELHKINAGLKVQEQKYTFDNGAKQNHNVSGIFVGYNYLFSIN